VISDRAAGQLRFSVGELRRTNAGVCGFSPETGVRDVLLKKSDTSGKLSS
jgi:hypothetical protein